MGVTPTVPLVGVGNAGATVIMESRLDVNMVVSIIPATRRHFERCPHSQCYRVFSIAVVTLSVVVPATEVGPRDSVAFDSA